MKAVLSFTVRPHLPEALQALDRLAGNLRWSWHRQTRHVFATIDPELWAASGHDPRLVLASVPTTRLDELAADPEFCARVAAMDADLSAYLSRPSWYDAAGLDLGGGVAYFSPEFGIAEAVPQYSGGLGILAGDHLKSASDLGVPLVGIGLFYRHGYFRQSVSVDGWQQERFPDLDPYAMSMTLVNDIRIPIELGPDTVIAQAWRAEVGSTPLYLLDTDISENADHLRVITDRLYGGDTEHRLRQEIVLGVGGVRLLGALGIDATVFHTNEGHAGFLGFERIRHLMREHAMSFDEALQLARAGCVFTTHTPVPAGIDRFPLELIHKYFGGWANEVGLSPEELVGIGHRPTDPPDERFNMAVMGMRLAERRNGVAKLHGEVSREMFGDLWSGVPTEEVPVGSVTNGVHPTTWISAPMAELFADAIGPDWDLSDDWSGLGDVDSAQLWDAHRAGTRRLVQFTRRRLRQAGIDRGLSPSELTWTNDALDPEVLTICFARRFATYKRATLLLSQEERLRELMMDEHRPVQFLFAGKAHPADNGGKELIRRIVSFSHDPEVRHRFVFLDNYDMHISRHLLHGADIWLNTPLRPQEACGTSGMKATMNGALNCSVLDGWWAECFDPELGWAISSAESVEDGERRDELEANSLFELLERQIVPRFYDRHDGLPEEWIATMRRSVIGLGPFLSSLRMVRDYVSGLYAPAVAASAALGADGRRGARELAAWRERVMAAWPEVHVDEVRADESVADLASTRVVTARVALGPLGPHDVEVQLVAGLVGQTGELEATRSLAMSPVGDAVDAHMTFQAELPLDLAGRRGITVRVVPRHRLLGDPLDLGCVAWAG
ncbi:MAG: alpha-glucan family phosphorylase [Microthrixaceae bacterium]|nr:alpha-glucan family phosphorylase [Microthrixaceae bacterium]